MYAATGLGALLGPLVANSCGGEGSIYMGGSERFSQFIMVIGFFIGTMVILPIVVNLSSGEHEGAFNHTVAAFARSMPRFVTLTACAFATD